MIKKMETLIDEAKTLKALYDSANGAYELAELCDKMADFCDMIIDSRINFYNEAVEQDAKEFIINNVEELQGKEITPELEERINSIAKKVRRTIMNEDSVWRELDNEMGLCYTFWEEETN